MLRIQHLLHPTDFSDGARAAFQHALYLARRHRATVHVLHVGRFAVDLPATPYPGAFYHPEGLEARLEADLKAELRTYVQAGEALAVPVVAVPPLFGEPPAAAIVAFAEKLGADLIVMGTHGRRGVIRAFVGSVAEAVLRRAPCPVLTVRARPDEGARPEAIRRVLVPVDLDFFAAEAVGYGIEVADAYGAALTLLHVVDVAADPDLATLPHDARERRLRLYEAIARERLGALCAAADPHRQVACHVVAGDPWEAVPGTAAHIGADLVVMPSHGLAGLKRLILGSVAEQVMRETPGAVLVVKPAGKSLLPPSPPEARGAAAGAVTAGR